MSFDRQIRAVGENSRLQGCEGEAGRIHAELSEMQKGADIRASHL